MNGTITRFAVATLVVLIGSITVFADTVQLANGDTLRGDVLSLDKKILILSSESFGELTIPREKVEAIYMGDARPPVEVVPGGRIPQNLSGEMPSLQNPQVKQMYQSLLNNLLGSGTNTEDIQENFGRARQQLQDLQKGMAPSEKKAVQGYIDLFNLLAPSRQQQPAEKAKPASKQPPKQPQGSKTTPPQSEPSTGDPNQ